ncbi:MAG: trypsin-like peptidase domain-containing protein, partial [Acidimicrobiales bacterium]
PSGDEYPATLVAFDADLDLAVLRVDEVQFEPVDLLAEVPLESGVAIGMRTASGVTVINEVEFEVDAPVIVNWDGVFRDTESQFLGIRIEAEIRRGDSGSPLFVNDDTVIGLIHSKNRSGLPRGYAVSSGQIAMFLDEVDSTTEVAATRCA